MSAPAGGAQGREILDREPLLKFGQSVLVEPPAMRSTWKCLADQVVTVTLEWAADPDAADPMRKKEKRIYGCKDRPAKSR